MTGSMCLVEIDGSAMPADLVPLLVSALVEDSQRLPDMFSLRFRDPERIVLSGDLAAYADMFTGPVCERIQGLVPTMPEIVASELGMDAAVLGAVAIAMRETSDALYIQPSRA